MNNCRVRRLKLLETWLSERRDAGKIGAPGKTDISKKK